ncbi:MAG: hypothetical protein BWY78_01366 [Alphaproteobacteria bacterium ADurb.Bin438]|nr:MAG: hypothetical protein BWY78_01366 [Alphaproteobacteria bacterium ADurb.Bin438]
MGDKEICFVSLSRIEPFLIEKEGLNQKIEPHQISEFILLHENGHRLDPCFNDEKNTDFLNEHQSEVFADTYASIKFLTMNDNPELIGYMSDYRNNGFIEDSYKMVTNIDKVSKDDAETAVKYYTSPAINEVLKTYKEDKKSFENLDDKAIIEMAKTITLSKSLPKEKCDSFIKGILDKNVPDEISDALNQSMKNLKIASFTAVKNDTETKNANKENINSKLFANLDKSLKQDISYDMAFLNAYVETTKEITQNSSNMEKNIENLRKLLGQKNNLKSDYAFNDYYKSIKEPLFFEQIEGKNAVDYYMAVKLRYVKNIIPVLQDIKSGKITDQTISKFKASLKYSKYSHLMAKKAEEYIKSNPDYVPKPINDDIKYDSENIAPPTMHNIFKNNQRVLRNATAKFNSDIMKQALNSRKVKR